jgi:hypothetical protein
MKKIHIINLGSVVPNGVGGADSGCIDLIYSFLLQEYKLDYYSYIKINQIGEELDEVIIKEGKKIHINIKYPTRSDFNQLDSLERNKIRLDIIHLSLIRIAKYDSKLNISQLHTIKNKILQNKFSFYFTYIKNAFKKNPALTAEIVVHPEEKQFEFYCKISRNNQEICSLVIYRGLTVPIYFDFFFSKGKWKHDRFIIFGKEKFETHVLFNECKLETKNHTAYKKHPLFELFRAGVSLEEKENAYNDWLHSLPPGNAAIVRESEN